jgi:hypothetical protein
MVAVLFRDDVVSFLTTPSHAPTSVSTLFTQRRKVTVSDPSDSFMVMLRCRMNRQFTIGTRVNDVSVFNF